MEPTPQQQLTRQHVSDSRLLQNLYKSEKAYVDHLAAAVAAAVAASSALSSWGTSEPADIASAAAVIADGLADVANAQRTHVQAIDGYRAALKDVLDREQSIRSIVRDRDILVKRLIKADQKRAKAVGSDPAKEAERYQKHLYAQRELAACEDALQAEENALIGVKRRTFKEALTMRMKTMGDAGAAMVDAAKDAIILLDSFDTNGQMPIAPPLPDRPSESSQGWEYAEQPYDLDAQHVGAEPVFNQFSENASVTPSQSASQVNAGAPYQRATRYEGGNFHDIGETSNGHENAEQRPQHPPANPASEADSDQDYQDAFTGHAHTNHGTYDGHQDALPEPPAPTPPIKEDRPPSRLAGDYPQVSMPPVPSAPSLQAPDAIDVGPIPRATRVYLRGQDSSSEDDEPVVKSPSGAGWTSHIGSGSHRRQDSGNSHLGASSAARPNVATRSNSFFGRMGRLFKTDLKNTPAQTSSPSKSHLPAGSASGQQEPSDRPSSRAETPSRGLGRGRALSLLRGATAPDSSDEEDPRELVRHVNPRQPLWSGLGKASSDIGTTKGRLASIPPSARITPGPMSARQNEEAQAQAAKARPVSMYETVASTSDKKKKKVKKAASTRRASSVFETGSEVGTAPTRAAGYGQGVVPTSVVKNGDAGKPSLQRQSSVRSTATAGGSTVGGKKKKASKAGVTAMNAFTGGETASKFSTANWIARPGGGAAESHAGVIAQAVANAGVVPKSETPPTSAPASKTTHEPATPTRAASVRSKAPSVASPLHVPSASKNPPLKPALKHSSGAVNRSQSQGADLSGYQDLPQLGEPIKAPPPISLKEDGLVLPSTLGAAPSAPSPTTSSAPSPGQVGEKKSKPSALLKLVPNDGFDGSGRLGVPGTSPVPSPSRDKAASDETTVVAKAEREPERARSPQLAMPKTEPFKLDLANLNGSSKGFATASAAATAGGAGAGALPKQGLEDGGRTPASESEFLTPTEKEAYHLYLSTPEEPAIAEVKPAQQQQQQQQPPAVSTIPEDKQEPADGVVRITERRTRLMPSRTYLSEKAPRISDASSSASEETTTEGAAAAPSIPPVHFSDSLHDEVQAAGRKGYAADESGSTAPLRNVPASTPTPAAAAAAPAPTGVLTAPHMAKSDTSESGWSRRKSVRMAPDVKLPPETSTSDDDDDEDGAHRGGAGGKQARASGADLPKPMRIAPPPAAPARVTSKDEGPIDLGGRDRPSWNTRIGVVGGAGDSSSDDEEGDGYASARRAFSSATRHLGAATGKLKPKTKGPATTSPSKPKKKKKAATNA